MTLLNSFWCSFVIHVNEIHKKSFGFKGDSANAVPNYQKLRVRVTHIWGNRRGQPNRSAMERPHPRGTAFLITVNLHAR